MNDLHDLAAPYVVDALDAAERADFELHLEGCEVCQADVVRLGEPVAAIAAAVATPPSPALRDKVLGQVAVTAQRGSATDVTPLAPKHNRAVTWALGIAAAMLTVVASVALLQLRDARAINSIVTAADAATIVLDGEGIEARFTYSVAKGRGVFVSDSLPDVAPAQAYQLWLIDAGTATPAGLFTPASGSTVVIVSDVVQGVTLGLTLEPQGGSPQPTGEVLLAGPLAG